MLQTIEDLASLSIARGCGFAALGISTFMLGLSWDMALASEAGGLLAVIVGLALMIKAERALHRPIRSTEIWSMLHRDQRPHPTIAQQVIGPILRRSYLNFASHATCLGAGLLLLSLVLQLLGAPLGALR